MLCCELSGEAVIVRLEQLGGHNVRVSVDCKNAVMVGSIYVGQYVWCSEQLALLKIEVRKVVVYLGMVYATLSCESSS